MTQRHTFRFVVFSTLMCVMNASGQSWGVWQPESDLPTNGVAKTHAIGLEVNNTLFVLGGPPWVVPLEDGTVYSMPIGGTAWTEEIGFDGFGYVLGQGGGVDDLGRIIIFGGDDPQDPGNFDKPPFEWNQLEGPWHEHAGRGPQAPAANFAFCTDDANRIYSIGGGPGENASGGNPNSTYAERFIGSTDHWEPIAPLPIGVANAAATADGQGHILVFGGIAPDGSTRTNEVMQYDLATNTWSTNANANMPVALSDHRATLGADGRIYILGGASGPIGAETVEQTTHVYNPVTNQWAIGPDMSEPRRSFASFTGSDDRVYVIGGDNLTGGSSSVESIYTTPCPEFITQPLDADLWQNSTISFDTTTIGGGTITYQWMHDGQPITDGTTANGSVVSGAQSASLRVEFASPMDAGAYWVEATNSCGTVLSLAANVSIRVPAEIPQHWTWTSLHPSYANSSFAYGVDNGIQVGSALFDTPEYLNLNHPTKWAGTAASAQNLTPAGSQGGSIIDFKGDMLVGWWWAPIQCYENHRWQTCYFQRGAWWSLDGTFHETNYSGFEYTYMSATDGVSIVGSGATDDEVGNVFNKGVIWQAPTFEFAQSVHPSGFPDSALTAVDGIHQFGNVSLPFQGLHAGMWTGTSASFVDMHPAGFINSTIIDASDGQQVGIVNQWHNPHAVIWSGTPESLVDIHPDGATESTVIACESGIQLGSATFDDGLPPHAAFWAGSKQTYTELNAPIPAGYLSFNAQDFEVSPDGTFSIVGSSWNQDLGRSEAILLTSTTTPPCVADLADGFGALGGDGIVDFGDFLALLGLVGPCPGNTPGCTGDIADNFGTLGGDGLVDFGDFLAMLGLVGPCP